MPSFRSPEIRTMKYHAWRGDGPRFDAIPESSYSGARKADIRSLMALYNTTPWVFAGVTRIINAVTSVRWLIKKGKPGAWTTIDPADTELGLLLESPNEFMTWVDLSGLTVADLKLTGWCLWEKVFVDRPGPGSLPNAIWRHRPDRFEIIPDEFKYWKGIQLVGSWQEAMLDPGEVVLFRFWNPMDDYNGIGSLMAAQGSAVLELFARAWNKSFFRNGAASVPEGIFMVDQPLDDEQYERLSARLRAKIGSPEVWRDPLLLEQGVTYKEVGRSQKDMQFSEQMDRTRDELLADLGVPPAMVGLAGGQGSFREQRQDFYQGTVLPMLKKIEATINRWLAPTGYRFEYDLNDILSLIEDLSAKTAMAEGLVTRGIITINEFRSEIGLPPVAWGDRAWMGVGMAPVDAEWRPQRPGEAGGIQSKPSTGSNGNPFGRKQPESRRAKMDLYKEQDDRYTEVSERDFKRDYMRTLNELKRRILDRARRSMQIQKQGASFENFDPTRPEDIDLLYNGVEPQLLLAINDAASIASGRLGVTLNPVLRDSPEFQRIAREWARDTLGPRLNTINDKLKEAGRRVTEQDITPSEALRALEKEMDAFFGEMVEDFSTTDTTIAAREGVLSQADPEVHKYKQWLSRSDTLVRNRAGGESHVAAHGQIVPISEDFTLSSRGGGEVRMSGPGDERGGGENVCRCRCRIDLLTKDEVPESED